MYEYVPTTNPRVGEIIYLDFISSLSFTIENIFYNDILGSQMFHIEREDTTYYILRSNCFKKVTTLCA